MSRREKIIVSVMMATVFLGGYLYFSPGMIVSQRGVEKQFGASTSDFVEKVIKKFKEDTTLKKELFAIRSAGRKWIKDPFLATDARLSDTLQRNASDHRAGPADTRLKLVYSGFLEVGARRLAIINGMEYTSGEALDARGYYVRHIQPHQVEIGKRNVSDTIILKLTDLEAGGRK